MSRPGHHNHDNDDSEPASLAESSKLCGGLSSMFRRQVDLAEILEQKLAGLTMPLGGGTLTFPSTLRVTTDSSRRTVRFDPPAVANVGGLVGKANVSGIVVNETFTQATPMIDGLPDFLTIELKW